MLVDDDPYVCDLFRLVLEHYNWHVIVAANADQAIEWLSSTSMDIVVLDLFLPGKDGYQTLAAMRALPQAASALFVATTAYYTSDTQQEVLSYGFDGYLPKPFVPTDLAGSLRSLKQGGGG
jgi:CheY-like chemotaxis protein